MILSKIISLLKGKSHANGTRVDSSARKPGKCGGFHSFAAQSERAVSDLRGLANLTEALADERSRNAHSDSRDPVLVESELLLAAAQESGMLVKAVGGDSQAPRVSEAQNESSFGVAISGKLPSEIKAEREAKLSAALKKRLNIIPIEEK